jgi:hypothetical protein
MKNFFLSIPLSFLLLACSSDTTTDTNVSTQYKIHKNVISTIFWVGETSSEDNDFIANLASAWDENWTTHFGGIDTPDSRNKYYPKAFIPKENPFYIALPYNDIDENGDQKKDISTLIPWYSPLDSSTQSICKNRWVKVSKGSKVAYAQWEDVGPFNENDKKYVFGDLNASNTINAKAGIDLSPALKTYLDLKDIDDVNWSFVDDNDVPEGAWKDIITISNIDWNKIWYKPNKSTSWQWQLTGVLNLQYDVDLYDIDLFDTPVETIQQLHAQNKKVICYFSAGSYEDWRPDKELFQKEFLGNNLDGWEGEQWLNIANPNLISIMLKRLDLAKEKGCDGVEPDNVDGYTNNTGFALTSLQQFNYNKRLADEAHIRGLSIGLKNDKEQVKVLEPYFDFSLSEECYKYDECDLLIPFIKANKPVFDAEYNIAQDEKEKLCNYTNELNIHTLLLPLDLDDSFRYSCY